MASTSSLPAAPAFAAGLSFSGRRRRRAHHLSFPTPSSRPLLLSSSSSKRSGIRPRRLSAAEAEQNEVRMPLAERLLLALYSVFVIVAIGPVLVISKVVGGYSSDAPPAESKVEPPAPEEKDSVSAKRLQPSGPPSEEAISQFMTQVAGLLKLVDSKDIVELELKQQGCELVIRKKEALPRPPAPAPVAVMPQPSVAVPVPSPVTMPPEAALKAAKPSHPPLKSPMAGTFYRSPAPGQPPFVKVGDKVNKGQVLCIVKSMKRMNEIKADKSGTVVDILIDDGKPVSIGQPIFVIEP